MAPNDYSDDEVEDETDVEEVEEDVEDDEESVEDNKKKRGKKFKDPNKPKRALSAFFMYSQANRQRVKEEYPDSSFGDVARILARKYKELPSKEKSKWEKKAAQDKLRYQEEMKHYVPSADAPSGGGGGSKAKRQKKDPNAPKRNMSAYFLYSIDVRPKLKAEHPNLSFGDTARMISEHFKALPPKERKFWDDRAAADKVRYQREMDEYKA